MASSCGAIVGQGARPCWASPRGAPGYVSSVVASLLLPALPEITTRETLCPGECPGVGNSPGPIDREGAWRGGGAQRGHPLLRTQ